MDEIRPKGTVQVKCSAPDCEWEFWVDCLDPKLPEGPFLCSEHDGTADKAQKKADDVCWFCGKDGCDAFDTEFDTFLHIECLRAALEKEPDHPEATHMKYLLDL